MTTSPAAPLHAIAIPPGSAAPCTRCGYDLRGSDESGRCPECGLRAYWSLRAPRQLSQYPARWVATMAWAAPLLAAAYGGLFLLLVLGFANVLDGVTWVAPVGLFVAAVLQLAAMWMLSRHSRHWSEANAPVNRWLLRLAPIGPVAAGAMGMYLEAVRLPQPEWVRTLLWLTMAGWVIAPPVALVRLRALAGMICDSRLARRSAFVGWGLLVSLVGTAAAVAFTALDADSLRKPETVAIFVGVLTAMLVFLLMAARILAGCVFDFARAARMARRAEREGEAAT